MSLQPGPEDHPDDSALTPHEDQAEPAVPSGEAASQEVPPEAPASPAAQQGAPGGDPWRTPPVPGDAPSPPPAVGGYQPAPPPAGPYPPAPPPPAGAHPPAGTGGYAAAGSGGYPTAGSGGYPPPAGALPPPPPPAAWGQGGAQPPGAPVGYGAWPAQQQPPQTEGKAIVGLILAIGSWVLCPLVLAVVALVLANQSNRAIDASGGRLEGRGINTATKVVSWINIALTALVGVLIIGFLIAVAANPDLRDLFNDLPSTGDTQF